MIDESRGRNFTDADIRALVEVLKDDHVCRFKEITVHDLRASIEFYQTMNKFMSSSWGFIWKIILTGTVGTLMAITALGAIVKLKEALGLDIQDIIEP